MNKLIARRNENIFVRAVFFFLNSMPFKKLNIVSINLLLVQNKQASDNIIHLSTKKETRIRCFHSIYFHVAYRLITPQGIKIVRCVSKYFVAFHGRGDHVSSAAANPRLDFYRNRLEIRSLAGETCAISALEPLSGSPLRKSFPSLSITPALQLSEARYASSQLLHHPSLPPTSLTSQGRQQ